MVPKLQSLAIWFRQWLNLVSTNRLCSRKCCSLPIISTTGSSNSPGLGRINKSIVEAPSRGFNYALAARIWRNWTANNGPLSHLLKETAETDAKNFIQVKEQWEPWSTHAAELVQSGIREFNHRKTMDGTARDKLIAQIDEAVQLADRVFALLSQAPQPAKTFRTEQVHQLLAARQRYLVRPAGTKKIPVCYPG